MLESFAAFFARHCDSMKHNAFTLGITTCHPEPRVLSGRGISHSPFATHTPKTVINRFGGRSLASVGMKAHFVRSSYISL